MNKSCFHLSVKKEGCPIHPIRNRLPNWCQSVVDHDSSSLCVSLGHLGMSSWWCRLVTVCQFARDLENIVGGVMVCGKNVDGSSSIENLPWPQRFSLIFLPMRELWSSEHESWSSEKGKPQVSLHLNLTFMEMPGPGSDPWAWISWYFYRHSNQYDWSIWLAIPREWWRYVTALLVNFAYLYQGKNLFAKYFSSQFKICRCSTSILFLSGIWPQYTRSVPDFLCPT